MPYYHRTGWCSCVQSWLTIYLRLLLVMTSENESCLFLSLKNVTATPTFYSRGGMKSFHLRKAVQLVDLQWSFLSGPLPRVDILERTTFLQVGPDLMAYGFSSLREGFYSLVNIIDEKFILLSQPNHIAVEDDRRTIRNSYLSYPISFQGVYFILLPAPNLLKLLHGFCFYSSGRLDFGRNMHNCLCIGKMALKRVFSSIMLVHL